MDTNPPTPTQAVSEPVAESAHEFKSRLITDACSKWSGSQKVEAGDIIEWIADYRVAVSTTAPASEPACKTCGGKRLVPDGFLYGEGGVEFSEPIACTKDCPDCSSASVAGAGEALSLSTQHKDARDKAKRYRECGGFEFYMELCEAIDALASLATRPAAPEVGEPATQTGWCANGHFKRLSACPYCAASATEVGEAPKAVAVPRETLSRWRKWCLGYEWPGRDWDSSDVYLAIADEIRTKYEGDSAPQPAAVAQPLTEARIAVMNREAQDQGVSGISPSLHLARAVERAHGILPSAERQSSEDHDHG